MNVCPWVYGISGCFVSLVCLFVFCTGWDDYLFKLLDISRMKALHDVEGLQHLIRVD